MPVGDRPDPSRLSPLPTCTSHLLDDSCEPEDLGGSGDRCSGGRGRAGDEERSVAARREERRRGFDGQLVGSLRRDEQEEERRIALTRTQKRRSAFSGEMVISR